MQDYINDKFQILINMVIYKVSLAYLVEIFDYLFYRLKLIHKQKII